MQSRIVYALLIRLIPPWTVSFLKVSTHAIPAMQEWNIYRNSSRLEFGEIELKLRMLRHKHKTCVIGYPAIQTNQTLVSGRYHVQGS